VITARAIGVLEELALNSNHGGARGLSQILGEGRDAIQKAISDLRELGYVATVSYGKGLKILKVTDAGFQFLESRTSLLLSRLNSNLNLNANLAKKQTEYLVDEEYVKVDLEVGGDMSDFPESYDPEDIDKARERARQSKYQEREEVKAKENEKRMQKRSTDPGKWSATDSAFEFADQMHSLWFIKPWQVTRSRFRIALSKARTDHGTDGAIEKAMMELFFQKLAHNSQLDDPEIVWKSFIKQFGSLKLHVERMTITEEDKAEAQEVAARSREKLKRV
jgi:biotin operon repressor